MIVVVPHVEVPADELGHPSGRLCLIREAVSDGTLSQEGEQLLVLCSGRAPVAASVSGRATPVFGENHC